MTLPNPSPLALPGLEGFDHHGVARIETTTLLPGGALATLTLRREGEHFTIYDEGNGRAAVTSLGIQELKAADVRRGTEIAQRLGLAFVDGNFVLAHISFAQLPAAIAYVAEASRAWATATVEAHQKARSRDLVSRAVQRLRASFPGAEVQVEGELAGASSKLHRFDVIVSLPQGRFATFESLVPAQSSIAATHLKFYDLKEAHPDWPREAFVEDLSDWSSADLAMIQQVASGVRSIGSSWDDLPSLAA